MGLILSILSLVLIVAGVIQLIQGQILFGVILVIVGLVLGSSFTWAPRRRAL